MAGRSHKWLMSVLFCLAVQGVPGTALAQVDVVELTAKDIADGYASGAFTAVELTSAFLERINTYEPLYNAFTFLNPDALETAAALDAELLATGPRGPLHGVPVVIKESMDFAGLPSTGAFAALSSQAGGVDLFPEVDATVVARLRDAGAIILGRTNMPAFSVDGTRTITSWAGTAYNAYDRTIAPGASSSGTASAVAASFAVLGLGEETGGSLQNPAGAQNLVSIKPTFGLVPTTGNMPLAASTRDIVGPHAKTVYDAAVTLDAIAGFEPDEPRTAVAIGNIPAGGYTSLLSTTALAGKRIGLFGSGWTSRTMDDQTRQLYDAAVSVLADQGALLVEDPFGDSGFDAIFPDTSFDFRGFESLVHDFEKYLEPLLPESADNAIEALQSLTGVDVFRGDGPLAFFVQNPQLLEDPDAPPDLTPFHNLRSQSLDVFAQVMEEQQIDALVYPQMLSPTPPLAGSERIRMSTVSEINIMGVPGVTVPGGYYANGSPFSVIFVDELFSEAELLSYAYDYEQATLHRTPPRLFGPGDYNGDGIVEQGDLDLVLLNWGRPASGGLLASVGWINDTPAGRQLLDQDELDRVLLNWGRVDLRTVGAPGVPEPSTAVLLALILGPLVLLPLRAVLISSSRPGAGTSLRPTNTPL
jgi:amidase